MDANRRRKQKKLWAYGEELALIELWREKISELRGQRKNSHVFADIASSLNDRGYNLCPEEVKMKIHNLTNRYRLEKWKIGPSGSSPSGWYLYNAVHDIIGSYKINENTSLIQESILIGGLNSSQASVYCASTSASADRPAVSSTPTAEDEGNPISNESAPPAKRKKTLNAFQKQIMQEFKETNVKLDAEFKRMQQVDEKMLTLESKIVKVEEERNEILKSFNLNNEKFQNDVLNVMRRHGSS